MVSKRSSRHSGLLFIGNRRVYRVKPGTFAIFLPRYLNHIWSTICGERRDVSVYIEIPEDIRLKIKSSLVAREGDRVSSWDRGLDFSKTQHYLISSIRSGRKPAKCYDMILLIQLANGARVSEAVRGFKEYLKTGNSTVEVPLSKRKKPKTRTILIPEIIEEYAHECRDLVDVSDEKLVARVKNHARRHGFNTHSLRLAFIAHQLKQGADPQKLAKITTGHKRLDYILKLIVNVSQKVSKQPRWGFPRLSSACRSGLRPLLC